MNGDQAKFLAEQLAATLRQEMSTTSKVLGAVNEDKKDYRPDAKSRTAWELATHIAIADPWFVNSALDGKFEWNPEATKAQEASMKTRADVVGYYEKTYGAAIDRITKASAEELTRIVDFFGMMQVPAVQYLMLTNNHSIHHRGQLSAYLRSTGGKVPNIYGPSGDADS